MKKRDYYFDNAKFILIFFVVFGHLVHSYITASPFFSIIYKAIYTFHMPAFILIAGYFARGIYKKGYIQKIVKKLIFPYLIFQFIYSIFYYFLFNQSSLTLNFLEPHWSLWFLLSLFYWNILLLAFSKLKPGFAIGLSILIGLGIGYVDWISNYLSLSRTFVFFPFFLTGYFLKKRHFQLVTTKNFRLFAICIIAAVVIVLFNFDGFDEKWLLGSKPYSELKGATMLGLVNRTAVYAINFLMVACFFAFVPKTHLFFTKWGKNTLYVYLLHGFIVKAFRGSQFETYIYQSQTFILIIFFSLILTFFLSSKLISTVIQPIIELRWSQLKEWAQGQKLYSEERGTK